MNMYINWRTCLCSRSSVMTKLVKFHNKSYIAINNKSICSDQFQHISNSSWFNKKSKLKFVQPEISSATKCIWQDHRRGIVADTKTTAVTIWEDLKQMRFSPVPALALGFSGLIPFVSPPIYMIFSQTFYSQMVFAQTAYGACILSFLGGVRWGFVIPEESACRADWLNLGYSVLPSLVAWTALLLPQPFSLLGVMSGIAGAAYFDTALKGYPPWFKGLRFTLSLGAVLSLWTVFLCQYMLSNPSEKQTSQDKIEEKVNGTS